MNRWSGKWSDKWFGKDIIKYQGVDYNWPHAGPLDESWKETELRGKYLDLENMVDWLDLMIEASEGKELLLKEQKEAYETRIKEQHDAIMAEIDSLRKCISAQDL